MWDRLRPLAILVLALFSPAAIEAQENSDDVGPGDVLIEEEPEDSRVPSGFVRRVPIGVLVDRGEQLARGLGSQAGVGVRRSGVDGSGAELTVRGASAGQVAVTLGGVPINPARGGGVDLDLVPPALLGSATVHRGGSAARWGQGALGGAIELEPTTRSGSWLGLGGGSFGTLRASTGVAAGDPELGAIFGADILRTDGEFPFRDAQGTPLRRVNADVQRVGTVGVATWRPTRDWRLRATNLSTFGERGRPGPSEFQQALDGARSSETGNTLGVQARRLGVWESGGDTLDIEVVGGHRYRSGRYRNPDRLLRSAIGYDSRASEHRGFTSLGLSLWLGDFGVFAGGDGRADLLETQSTSLTGERLRDRHRRNQAGSYASALGTIGPLTGHLGVRAEKVDRLDAQLSPAGGVVWELGAGFAAVANLARAWRAPSLDELYLDEEVITGDPNLLPETATSADAGLRWRADRASVEVAAFWLEIDELILFLPVSPTLYRAQNVGAARSVGGELSGRWGLGPVALLGAWTVTDARFVAKPGDPLPGRPVHQGEAEVRIGTPVFEIWARARGRSRVYLDNFGNLSDDPTLYFDAGALGRPAPGWTVALVGENLSDSQSVDHLQQPLPGLSWKIQVTARGPEN